MSKTLLAKNPDSYGRHMMLAAVLLSVVGLMLILSATSVSARMSGLTSSIYMQKQAVRVGMGIVMMFIFSRIDYHKLRWISFAALMVSLVMLIICIIPGTHSISPVIGGARRWIKLGPLTFQPSELTKFFLIIWAAGYAVRKQEVIRSFKQGFLPFICVTGLFFLLIVGQPDLSTALIIMMMVLAAGYIGGIKPTHLIILMLIAAPVITYKYVVKVGYRSERLTSFLDSTQKKDDRSGSGYQAYQSKVALGSGGVSGVGLGQSKQKYFFLPAAHTDFILAILGEEIGFIGTSAVVLLFLYLGWLGYRIALLSGDFYGFLLASGLTVMIILSALLNIAVVSGLAPTTGLPLPFLSYGGTNLLTSFCAIGIIKNISRQAATAGA